MSKKPRAALDRAIKQIGGIPALAEKLGITRHAIYQWNQVPYNHVIAIEAATGVSRQALRPDLYPKESRTP